MIQLYFLILMFTFVVLLYRSLDILDTLLIVICFLMLATISLIFCIKLEKSKEKNITQQQEVEYFGTESSVRLSKNLLIEVEGYLEKTYTLYGSEYICYGNTKKDYEKLFNVNLNDKKATLDNCNLLLENHIRKYVNDINNNNYGYLNSHQTAGLTSLVYSLKNNEGRLKNTVLKKCISEGINDCIIDNWLEFALVNNEYIPAMLKRRQKELYMFYSGYNTQNKAMYIKMIDEKVKTIKDSH